MWSCRAVTLGVLAGVIAAGGHAADLLGPAVNRFPVGPTPTGVAVADLNGDRALDLAVATAGRDSVRILLGDGRGGFSSGAEVLVGDFPEAVAAADFDQDGDVDLAVTNLLGNSVAILLGDDRGGFSVSEIPSVPTPVAVAVADFDRDGAVDLAVANRNPGTLTLLFGQGDGDFTIAPAVGGVGPFPFDLAVADFDANGAPDLAVANLQGNTVSILLGDGAGGFAPAFDLAVGLGPLSVAAGDLDADGAADLAVANGASGSLSLLLGDGRGGFAPPVEIATGVEPIAISVVDLDADGAVDLAVANRAGGTVSLLLGDGQGGFARSCIGTGPAGECLEVATARPRQIAAGDFDGNGAADLALTNNAAGTASVLLGDGLGGIEIGREIAVGPAPEGVAAGDFNRDGTADLAVAETLGNSVAILLGDGLGGFTPLPGVEAVGNGPNAIAVGDFDDDDDDDLAVANLDSDDVAILLGNGRGGFTVSSFIPVRDGPTSIVTADFDRDGDLDLAAVSSSLFSILGNSVTILLGRGDGSFVRDSDPRIRNGPGAATVGDFDEDDVWDLAVTASQRDEVQIFLGNGDGRFSFGPTLLVGSDPSAIAALDFDVNGHVDLAVTLEDDDALMLLAGQGDGTFVAVGTVPVSDAPASVTTADVNADGFVDLVVANSGSDSLTLLLGDGRGSFTASQEATVGDQPLSIARGDFDADGEMDLATANRRSESVSVLFGRLRERADVNGSNRVDGVDIAAIGTLMGATAADPGYRRSADTDLNLEIDGDDLALAAIRFGELNRLASPLRAALDAPFPPVADTITLQPSGTDGDLIHVEIRINDADDATSGANFALTFEPTDGDPNQVFEVAGFDPGAYFSGGIGQIYQVDDRTPGRANIAVTRLPLEDRTGSGEATLMTLALRARRSGTARLDFAAFGRNAPAILDAAGQQLAGIAFRGGVDSRVDASAGGPPGQKLGLAPAVLDFGSSPRSVVQRGVFRLANFGFSELAIRDVRSSRPEFVTFFTSPFSIPPFGFVELTVEFAAAGAGLYAADLAIDSDDPQRPTVYAGMVGRSELALAVSAARLDFGSVAVGTQARLDLTLENRGADVLTLTAPPATSDPRFAASSRFSILNPGERGIVEVGFSPDAAGEFRADLSMGFLGGADPSIVVRLTARGR